MTRRPRTFTPAWQAVRDARAARRAIDPQVQARAERHARREAEARAKAEEAAA